MREQENKELPPHLQRLADVAASLISMAAYDKNDSESGKTLIEESRRRMRKWLPADE